MRHDLVTTEILCTMSIICDSYCTEMNVQLLLWSVTQDKALWRGVVGSVMAVTFFVNIPQHSSTVSKAKTPKTANQLLRN